MVCSFKCAQDLNNKKYHLRIAEEHDSDEEEESERTETGWQLTSNI